MMNSNIKRILIFGAAGSGSTTLAEALKPYGYAHVEVDEAIFELTDPPFLKRRTEQEARAYLETQVSKHEYVVISGAMVGFGDSLKSSIDLFIFLHIPTEERITRIKQRELSRFGSRVLPGGDMYQMHMDFLAWVKAYETGDDTVRSLAQHRKWLSNVQKPVIEITTVLSVEAIIEKIIPFLENNHE